MNTKSALEKLTDKQRKTLETRENAMNKAAKVQITKCYLIQILDKDGNELACDYSFVSRQDAKIIGERMKADYNADMEKGDTNER